MVHLLRGVRFSVRTLTFRLPFTVLLLAVACGAGFNTLRASEERMSDMRIVFSGYVNYQPRWGSAIVRADGISDVKDVRLLYPAGEISPDGRRIAYTTCSSWDRGIYIARIDGSGARLVPTTPGDYCVYAIRWSPDGKKVSYGSEMDYMLHLLDIETGVDRPMFATNLGGWGSWSPEGDEIVFENGRGGSRLLQIVDTTGRIRQLTYSKDFGECESWAPAWSPDGERIAFTACSSLYTIKPDGTDVRRLTPRLPVYCPRWSVDGNWLLFLSNRTLERVRADGGAPETLGVLPYRGGPFSLGPLR
jgi:dipeptidyl aminopeptidase/acylaminoacyl peptidase